MENASGNGGDSVAEASGSCAASATHVGARAGGQPSADERRRQRIEQSAARNADGVGGRGRLQRAAATRLRPLRVGRALQIQKQHQTAFFRRAPPRRKTAATGVAGAARLRPHPLCGGETRHRRRLAAPVQNEHVAVTARLLRPRFVALRVRGASVRFALQGRFLHPVDHRQRDVGALHECLQRTQPNAASGDDFGQFLSGGVAAAAAGHVHGAVARRTPRSCTPAQVVRLRQGLTPLP